MADKKRKLTPNAALKLPDLEQSKSAVLNSLTPAALNARTITLSVNSSTGTVLNLVLTSTKPSRHIKAGGIQR
jgi:hypothetical protein